MAGKKVAKVVHVEESKATQRILLPSGMSHDAAIEWLHADKKEQESEVQIDRTFDAFVLEGGFLFAKALRELFGLTHGITVRTFFSEIKPEIKFVDVGGPEPAPVPWGRFSLPGVDGWVHTVVSVDANGFPRFRVVANVRRKHRAKIDALLGRTEELVRAESIYHGRAIALQYRDASGRLLDPEDVAFDDFAPRYLHPTVKPEDVIFDAVTEQLIRDYVFTPITHRTQARQAGVPDKRGVMLAGPFGVGKTMVGAALASLCESNATTFLHIADVRDLHRAVDFARRYSPAVVWAEDIDRAVGLERTVEVDRILNTLDGVSSKDDAVMVVVTTNNLSGIHPALKRPGRFDVIATIPTPDALAAEKLVRLYARGLLVPGARLDSVGAELRGRIPAVIREVVERSKLSALRRLTPGGKLQLNPADLLLAARSMSSQLKAMSPAAKSEAVKLSLSLNGSRMAGELRPSLGEVFGKNGDTATATQCEPGCDCSDCECSECGEETADCVC